MDIREQKRTAIRDYLSSREQPEPAVPEHSNTAFYGGLLGSLGNAVEDYGRAESVARGGRGTDSSFYKGLSDNIAQNEDAKRKAQLLKVQEARDARDRQFGQIGRLSEIEKIGTQEKEDDYQSSVRGAERDPESKVSQVYQSLAKRMSPGKDFSGMSAAEIKQSLAPQQALYSMEQKAKDREEAKAQRVAKTTREEQQFNQKMNKENFKNTQDLRKEYTAHPISKSSKVLEESFSKIMTTDQNGPGDMALIFNYMKMLDPGSTVREGEFASAVASGGVPSQIVGLYNKVRGDGMLDTKTRNQIRQQSQLYYDEQLKRQAAVDTQFENIANSAGIDFSQINRALDRPKAREKKEEAPKKLPRQIRMGGKLYDVLEGGALVEAQ